MPTPNRTITITRDALASALAKWETDARSSRWPDRDDAARHDDAADYLLAVMEAEAA